MSIEVASNSAWSSWVPEGDNRQLDRQTLNLKLALKNRNAMLRESPHRRSLFESKA